MLVLSLLIYLMHPCRIKLYIWSALQFKATEEEVQLSANIFILWSELFKESRRVDRSLAKVKKTFAEVVPIIYQSS